ncbi:MAG: hypothetical protein JSV81_08445 [Anaerolineales bacterium]|nr:MAG: hypothetical protein JSV81_08445 [Anaerolineales bacterium]
MASYFNRAWCDECGTEITWTPVMIDGRPYCCHDCAVGLECACANTSLPRWDDELGPFWVGSIEGNIESTYGIEYNFE